MFTAIPAVTGFNIDFLLDPVLWLTVILCLVGLILLVFGVRFLYRKLVKNVRVASFEKKSLNAVIFEVRVPKNNEVESQAADQMFSSLLAIGASDKGGQLQKFKAKSFVSFEIVAFPEVIRFFVVASKNLANTVEKAINGAYPTADIVISDEYNVFSDGSQIEYASLKLDAQVFNPIKTYDELSTDSMSTLLSTISKLAPKEAVAYQVLLTESKSKWRNKGKSYVSGVRAAFSDPEKKSKPKVSEDVLAAIEKKCEKGGFNVDVRLMVVSPEADNAKNILETLISTFSQFKKEGSNSFKKSSPKGRQKMDFIKNFIYRIPDEETILNTAELATIFHFPNIKIDVPNINWLILQY